MISQWLKDVQADIAAGTLRVISDEADRQRWQERGERKACEAQALAEQYGYSPLALDWQIRRRQIGMFDCARVPAFRRAFAIALDR